MTKKQILKHTVSYEEGLIKSLKDPKEARAYLEVLQVLAYSFNPMHVTRFLLIPITSCVTRMI